LNKITDAGILHHEKVVADAEFYKIQKAAEANKLLHTSEYIKLETIKSITNSTKIYFGPSIQNMFLDFFDTIMNQKFTKGNL
jgi:hypothetical protein